MAPEPQLPNEPDDDPEAYVGLARQEAEERAGGRGWSVVRALPPGALITMEYRAGRLNFEVEDGRVRRSWRG
ncbi:I78 family peptidase inhibitor [Streptomyces sp. NPDC059080]|uniref:I78 family peptidase inhibitor n=1 Tax=Streptomyces sp. NPDC059080 TaxID=3346718 RepID=UPI0036C98874